MDKDTMMDREALGRRIVLLRKQKRIQPEGAGRTSAGVALGCL